ncbi:MAG: helix-turn-helix domain-containing protein [Acidimicrobiales bacterium]
MGNREMGEVKGAETVTGSPLDDPSRLAFSVDEVAHFLGIGRSLLYEQIRRGQFPYIRVGKRYLITRQGLASYLISEHEHVAAG